MKDNKFSIFGDISEATMQDLEAIARPHSYARGELFLQVGQTPKNVALVIKGLFSQYFASPDGDLVIKKFFPEKHFAGSLPALLTRTPSTTAIKALERTETLEYNFQEFKALMVKHADLGASYIRYLEVKWVIEKEPLEISFRNDNARTRYLNFLRDYPGLEPRLKQHEVASYLGITPTQLSRIRGEM